MELNSYDVARSGRTPLLGREYTHDGSRALESQKQVLDEEGVLVSIWLKTHTPTDTLTLNKTKWVSYREPTPLKEKGLFTAGSPHHCPMWRSTSKTNSAFKLQDVPTDRVLCASGHESRMKRHGLNWGTQLKLMPYYLPVFKACRDWYKVKYNQMLHQFTKANSTSMGQTGTENEDISIEGQE